MKFATTSGTLMFVMTGKVRHWFFSFAGLSARIVFIALSCYLWLFTDGFFFFLPSPLLATIENFHVVENLADNAIIIYQTHKVMTLHLHTLLRCLKHVCYMLFWIVYWLNNLKYCSGQYSRTSSLLNCNFHQFFELFLRP